MIIRYCQLARVTIKQQQQITRIFNKLQYSTTMAGKSIKMVINEGSASMLYDKSEAVFYNKVQVLNRDVSIQVTSLFFILFFKFKPLNLSLQVISLFATIRAQERSERRAKKQKVSAVLPSADQFSNFDDSIHILDALAATGLRSVRYLKEIPLVRHVTVNDLDPSAISAASENISRNSVDPSRVSLVQGDACMLMYSHKEVDKRFDVIDLDPYGSAVPFLDAAVQVISSIIRLEK
jgi:tRNA (guanine26-N2/guanine27-N2)-dimethyltransferase